jgi:hypothetical protein
VLTLVILDEEQRELAQAPTSALQYK